MPDEKSVRKSVPGKNGGTLYPGSLPGERKGTGRPPDELRKAMRESMWGALELLNKKLENPDISAGELAKALDTFGKFGLGPAAPENPVPAGDQVVLTMDARTKQDDDETND